MNEKSNNRNNPPTIVNAPDGTILPLNPNLLAATVASVNAVAAIPNANTNGGGGQPESLEEHHGQRMDQNARQALMMKLARTDAPAGPTPGVHPSRMNMVPYVLILTCLFVCRRYLKYLPLR